MGRYAGKPALPTPQLVSWDELPGHDPVVYSTEERTDLELLITDRSLLSESERKTLYLSYFADHSLAEIGALLGVTESRACQVRKAAIVKLRTALELNGRNKRHNESV
jgi:DNA-directed RNA polymerase specialized sigma subunit